MKRLLLVLLFMLPGVDIKAAEALTGIYPRNAEAPVSTTMMIFEDKPFVQKHLIGVLSYDDVPTCRKHRQEFLWYSQIIHSHVIITCTPRKLE